MKTDILGKQYVALHEVRDSVYSSAASLTNGTATTLSAGDSDYPLDIIEMTCANNSTAAATFTLGNDGSTVRTFVIPAGTTQFQFFAPLKQPTKNTPWTVDMEDITGTTLSIFARLIKNR